MKKRITSLLLALSLALSLAGTALAAEPTESGMYKITNQTNWTGKTITIAAYDAGGNAITGTNATINSEETTFFPQAEKVTVTISGADSGVQYLLLALSGSTATPTESNIVYIDQAAGNGGDLTFTVYPKQLSAGEYHIYVTSSTDVSTALSLSQNEVGSFWYYAAYVLGRVDNDDAITATDALWALQAMVNQRVLTENQKRAADVDKDGSITATDALWILQTVAGQRVLN